MRPRHLVPLVLVLPALTLAAAGGFAAGPNGDYVAELAPVNEADADGHVDLLRHGTTLDVHLQASGLDEGTHVAHIHGIRRGMAECPDLAEADDDANGLVDFAEGLPDYGPVLRTLSRAGDAGTTLDYARTFTTMDNGDDAAKLGRLDRYVVVVHGVDLTGDGLVSQGNPDPARNEISMPALCGLIEVVGSD